MTDNPPTRATIAAGRIWAYIGVVLGVGVSIAANVAHSYVPPLDKDGKPLPLPTGVETYTPEPGAVFGAVIWPVFLFMVIEIWARNDWGSGGKSWAIRLGGLLPVGSVAAVVSYLHMSGLLNHYGENPITVTVGPFAVDGLMVIATGALIVTKKQQRDAEVHPLPTASEAPPVVVPEATAGALPVALPTLPDLAAGWAAIDAAEAPDETPAKRFSRPLRRTTQKHPRKPASEAPVSASEKRSLTDEEAVDLLIEKHPKSNPSKREAQALLKVHFNRVGSIFELADQKRSEKHLHLVPADAAAAAN